MRILVTGSRDYSNKAMVHAVLGALCSEAESNETIYIVDGAAKGADTLAAEFGSPAAGFRHERYPADWDKHGKAAGFVRNKFMVDLGADVCVAFKDQFNFDLDSGGTEHCANLAKAAGIPVYVVCRL